MPRAKHAFRTSSPMHRTATCAESVVVVGLAVFLHAGVRLALGCGPQKLHPESPPSVSPPPSPFIWGALKVARSGRGDACQP